MDTTDFDSLSETEAEFYGADDATETFKLGDQVWRSVQDESDGYRSYLGSVDVVADGGTFPTQPIARVRVEIVDKDNNRTLNDKISNVDSGYRLVDVADNHVWLVFGTDNEDDYYPGYVWDYQPKSGFAQKPSFAQQPESVPKNSLFGETK